MGTIANIIRYVLLKVMKKLRRQGDDRPAMVAADQLLDKLLPSAFRVFQDSQFRKVAGFDKLNQSEHDRIFNELEVVAMSLCLFCLEQRELIVGNDDFHFWKDVHAQIPIQFEQKLLGFGADKENAKLFKDLIKIRHNEYAKISDKSRDYFKEHKDFKGIGSEEAKNALARVHAVTVGAADHVRRGKLKRGDELLRVMRSWLFPLDMEITKFIRKL